MRSTHLGRPALCLAAFCVAALGGAPAGAQIGGSTNVVVDNVDRRDGGHSPDAIKFHISQKDCTDKEAFEFPVSLTNLSGVSSFEVWVGEGSTACNTQEAFDEARCTKLEIDTRLVDEQELVITSDVIANAVDSVAECHDDQGLSSGHAINIYFMLIRPENVGVDIPAEDFTVYSNTKVDLAGPPPPDDLEAGPTDQGVVFSYKPREEEDADEFVFLCDDGSTAATGGSGGTAGAGGAAGGAAGGGGMPGGAGGMAGGGSGGSLGKGGASIGVGAAGGGGAGGTSTSGCGSGALVPGAVPDRSFICGSVRGTKGTTSKKLENYKTYAVAVAGKDDLDNLGTLSKVICVTPEPIEDFYSLYRDAGGTAGGGFCGVSAPGNRQKGALALLLAASVGLMGLLRRRSRKRVER